DRTDPVQFVVADLEEQSHMRAPVPGERVLEVPGITLDSYCADRGVDQILLLKIDTEGSEPAVLRGARTLLEEGRIHAIQFEYGSTWAGLEQSLHDIVRWLLGMGYTSVTATGRPSRPKEDLKWQNVFMLRLGG